MIAIVTAAYNCSPFIYATYESLRRQTLQHWEWIVVDDHSTDGTFEALEGFAAEDDRVRVLRNDRNQGAAFSRNRAMDEARGTFLAFIDSDDLWLPEKLATQVDFMSTGIDFSFTGYQIVNEDGSPTSKRTDVSYQGRFGYEDMLAKKATLGCSTVMLRRSAIGDLRMPMLKSGQDYAYWLSLLRSGIQAHLLPEVLTSYRIRKNSLSRNKLRKARQQWRIYRNLEKLSLLSSIRYFLTYAVRALIR